MRKPRKKVKVKVKPEAATLAEPPSHLPLSRPVWHNHYWFYFLFVLAMLAIGAWVGWYIVAAFQHIMDKYQSSISFNRDPESSEGSAGSGSAPMTPRRS